MSDWGGTQSTIFETDPSTQALQALRLQMAQSVASGDWSGMQGFFDKVLIPTTMNQLTAAGLGRSGALGEAVAMAQLSYGTDFLKALLSGVPSGQTQTQQYQPGPMDWISMALQGVGGMFR